MIASPDHSDRNDAQGRSLEFWYTILMDPNVRRYFFDLSEDGRFFPDREGAECPDEESACAVAKQKVRRLVRRRLRDGSMPTGGYVSIRLGCGERLMFMPYRDAMNG